MAIETKILHTPYPGKLVEQYIPKTDRGIGPRTDTTVLEPNTILTLHDFRDRFSSPIIDGWRAPNVYIRKGLRASVDRGLWSRTSETTHTLKVISGSVDMSAVPNLSGFHESYDKDGFPISDWNFENHSVNEALAKLKGESIALGVYGAESAMTAKMLARRGEQLFGALRAITWEQNGFEIARDILGFRKGAFTRGIKDWQTFVLEYQYGWKPFISDCFGLYNLFAEQLSGSSYMQKGRASVSEQLDLTKIITTPWYGSTSVNGHRRQTVALLGEIELSSLRAASKLGLINPLEIAWERKPFSFVIDWALPIGQVISNMTSTCGLRFKAGTSTLSSKLKQSSTRIPTGSLGWQVVIPAVYKAERYSMHRKVLSSFPFPLPYVKNPFSTQHAINATALFYQTRVR